MTLYAFLFTIALGLLLGVCAAILVKGYVDDRRLMRSWREYQARHYYSLDES